MTTTNYDHSLDMTPDEERMEDLKDLLHLIDKHLNLLCKAHGEEQRGLFLEGLRQSAEIRLNALLQGR